MRKVFGCLMTIGFLVLMYVFFLAWRGTRPAGVGTGNIGGRSSSATGARSTPATPKGSALSQIASNPRKWNGKRVTISGRVRGNARYATNRNLYRLIDGKSTLLIVDDQTPPKEYSLRSVSGTVRVVKPPIGKGYAYVVSVKGDPKIDLKWPEVKGFFSAAASEMKKGAYQLGEIKKKVDQATQ